MQNHLFSLSRRWRNLKKVFSRPSFIHSFNSTIAIKIHLKFFNASSEKSLWNKCSLIFTNFDRFLFCIRSVSNEISYSSHVMLRISNINKNKKIFIVWIVIWFGTKEKVSLWDESSIALLIPWFQFCLLYGHDT